MWTSEVILPIQIKCNMLFYFNVCLKVVHLPMQLYTSLLAGPEQRQRISCVLSQTSFNVTSLSSRWRSRCVVLMVQKIGFHLCLQAHFRTKLQIVIIFVTWDPKQQHRTVLEVVCQLRDDQIFSWKARSELRLAIAVADWRMKQSKYSPSSTSTLSSYIEQTRPPVQLVASPARETNDLRIMCLEFEVLFLETAMKGYILGHLDRARLKRRLNMTPKHAVGVQESGWKSFDLYDVSKQQLARQTDVRPGDVWSQNLQDVQQKMLNLRTQNVPSLIPTACCKLCGTIRIFTQSGSKQTVSAVSRSHYFAVNLVQLNQCRLQTHYLPCETSSRAY